jgi:hypothetical protein
MSTKESARTIRDKKMLLELRGKTRALADEIERELRAIVARDVPALGTVRGIVDAMQRALDEHEKVDALDERAKLIDAIPKHADGAPPTGAKHNVRGVEFYAYRVTNGLRTSTIEWRTPDGRAKLGTSGHTWVKVDGEFIMSRDSGAVRRFTNLRTAMDAAVTRMNANDGKGGRTPKATEATAP